MKKILMSILVIGLVLMLLGAGTFTYFTDIEISRDNFFQAGSLDLKIDCESYWYDANGTILGSIVFPETDLTIQKFFNWSDIKPGDHGEATISLHVIDNDAWLCWHIKNYTRGPGITTGPEPTPDNGELAQNMNTKIWVDEGTTPGWQGKGVDPGEGDNIWQPNEDIIYEGIMHDFINNSNNWLGPTHLIGCETYYIGWAWEVPATVGNIIQDDWINFDVEFYVEQYRNNPDFICGSCRVDLEINKTVNILDPLPGDIVKYTISVCNGDCNSVEDIIVADGLPACVNYINHSASQGTYNYISGLWNVGFLDVGECATLTINATVLDRDCVDLVFIIDGSDNVSSTDFDIMINGLADAINDSSCCPHDGSVELIIVQYGLATARTELYATKINSANKNLLVNKIKAITQMGGQPNMYEGIKMAAFTPWLNCSRKAVNLVTASHTDFPDSVIAMRDILITAYGMIPQKDEFDAEAIGPNANAAWLKDNIVWPQVGTPPTGVYAPPFPTHNVGWVRPLINHQEFADTICEKIYELTQTCYRNCAELISSNPHDTNPTNDKSCVTIQGCIWSPILSENFSGGVPPSGWTINDIKWGFSNTNYAGGASAPEARFSWTPSTTGNLRLYTFPIDTTGFDECNLTFNHFVNHYTQPYTLMVETSTDGLSWSPVWSINPTSNVGPQPVTIPLSTADGLGSSTFYISFTFSGNSFNINYWYIDDVILHCLDCT